MTGLGRGLVRLGRRRLRRRPGRVPAATHKRKHLDDHRHRHHHPLHRRLGHHPTHRRRLRPPRPHHRPRRQHHHLRDPHRHRRQHRAVDSGRLALRVEPVRVRQRQRDLRRHGRDGLLRRRGDQLRRRLGDRDDPLPRPDRRRHQPVSGFVRLRRPLRPQAVTAYNGVGLTASSQFTVTPDTAEPSGGRYRLPRRLRRGRRRHRRCRRGHRCAFRRRTRVGRPRAAHGKPLRWGLRPVRRRLDHGYEPRHGRVQPVCPVPLPRLRPRGQRGRLHVRQRRQGRPRRPGHAGAHARRVEPLCARRRGRNLRQYDGVGLLDVEAATSDAVAGIDKVSFPGGVDDANAPYTATYDFGDLSGTETVTAHDRAGNVASADFEVTEDVSGLRPPPTTVPPSARGG